MVRTVYPLLEINWSNSCICNTSGDLRSTSAGIESLAKQIVAWLKHGILPFDTSKLSNSHIVGDDGDSYLNFQNVMKANITTINVRTISLITNSRKKIESIQKKKSTLSDDHSPNLRSSSMQSSTDSSITTCIICNEIDEVKYLHAAGALHATKTRLKADHVTKRLNNGDIWLQPLVTADYWESIENLEANSSFYHNQGHAKLYNDFIKTDNKEKQGGLDILKIRAAAWDKVITFMNEKKKNSNGFDIHDLQDMYLDFFVQM